MSKSLEALLCVSILGGLFTQIQRYPFLPICSSIMHCIGPKYCKKTRGISNPFASKSVGGFTESVLPPSCLYSGQWPYPSVLGTWYKKHEPQQKEIKNLLSQKKIQQSLRNTKLPGVIFVSGRGMFSPYPSWLCVFWVKQNQQVKKKKKSSIFRFLKNVIDFLNVERTDFSNPM